MEYLKDFDVIVNKTFSPAMKPVFVKAIVHLLLVLYAARIAPTLPKTVYDLFENQYFKLFIFSLILWTAQFSPSISILISLAFIMTVNYANKQPLWEFMENVGDKKVIDAVKELANAAASPEASSVTTIAPLVNTVAPAIKTEQGAVAVKALAEQAMTPSPGNATQIMSAVQTVVISSQTPTQIVQTPTQPVEIPVTVVPAPAPTAAPAKSKEPELQPAPCYSIRRHDMSKVGSYEVGSYQDWKL